MCTVISTILTLYTSMCAIYLITDYKTTKEIN